ncbi:cadherin-like domain-containing protein [Glaciecola sp. 1036]|uniref:cadherin-like domain-containing protein n=1 Tax=Alteromonadaceae TaxID=72275 RepID=UPI003CFDEA95
MNKNNKIIILSLASLALSACGGSGGDNNSAPQFNNSVYSVTTVEEEAVTSQVTASDADGDSLTYTLASAPTNGTISINANGNFTYTPNMNFAGTDSAQIAVSDGTSSVNTTVNITVTNINDAPVIQTTSVTVSSQGTSTGSITVSDPDGDTVTFTLVNQPANGSLTLDTTTGDFEYTPASLEQIDGSFTISFTDGIISTPIQAEINLTPSYSTNADKLSYYYTSIKSNLKQADAMIEAIGSDEYRDDVRESLAVGYTTAEFDDQAESYLDQIATLDRKANALLAVGERLDQLGKVNAGNDARYRSQALYNQFLAEKGLENMNRDDASYFISIINDYGNVNNADAKNNMISTVQIYAEAINSEVYSTTYGRLLSAARINLVDLQEAYYNSGTDADKVLALDAARLLEPLAMNVGYRVVTRGEFSGRNSYQLRGLYLGWLAEHYFHLDQEDKAKQYLAEALALYGVTNYDPEYVVAVSADAEVTLASYTAVIENLAGLFEYYYPDADTNLARDLLAPEANDYADATIFMYMYRGLKLAEAGQDLTPLFTEVRTFFEENGDLRDYYEFLVQQGASGIRLAGLLLNRGYDAYAREALETAASLIQEEAYITEETALRTFGTYGCFGLNKLYVRAGGDADSIIQACESIAESYYQAEDGNFTEAQIAEAYKALIGLYALNDNQTKMQAVADNLIAQTAQFTDLQERFEARAEAAALLSSYGLLSSANSIITQLSTDIQAYLETEDGQTADALEDLARNVLPFLAGDTSLPENDAWFSTNVKTALRLQATSEGFSDQYSAFLSHLQNLTLAIADKVQMLTVNEQQDVVEFLVLALARADLYTQASAWIDSDINAVAEQYELRAILASHLAEKDAFPGSAVANVDTDNDGLPNFFLLTASQADIDASGLVADNDADNDGILDAEDSTPLGE